MAAAAHGPPVPALSEEAAEPGDGDPTGHSKGDQISVMHREAWYQEGDFATKLTLCESDPSRQ